MSEVSHRAATQYMSKGARGREMCAITSLGEEYAQVSSGAGLDGSSQEPIHSRMPTQ